MKILGLPLWREKISDEQYVELIRKSLKRRRALRYFMAIMGLVLLCVLCWLVSEMFKLLGEINNVGHAAQGSKNWPASAIYAGYFIGIIMGYYTGFMFSNAISHIVLAFVDYRKDRLLVECWDCLSDTEKTRLRQRSS